GRSRGPVGGDLRAGRRDAARGGDREDQQEGAPAPRQRARVGSRRREVRAGHRGAGRQPQSGGGSVGAAAGQGGRSLRRAAHRRRGQGRAENHRPGRRGHGGRPPQGRRRGGLGRVMPATQKESCQSQQQQPEDEVDGHTTKLRTNIAFSSMNLRRGSTSAPISVTNSSEASTASSIAALRSVRFAGSMVV